MHSDPGDRAAHSDRIRAAVARVRGRAETSGGAVVVESDLDGGITALTIAPSAMSVDPARLANAIMQCHNVARERAQVEADKLFDELRASPEASRGGDTSKTSDTPVQGEWETPGQLRVTRSV
ncbi:YbaB/EbfC family nucleoid-associated protein [Nocardia sp. NPDC003693]